MAEAPPAGLAPVRIEEKLHRRFPDVPFLRQEGEAVRDHTLFVPDDRLGDACTFLRDDPELAFTMLVSVAGVDYLPRDPRFEVVYHLLSIPHHARVVLKVQLGDERPRVPSVTGVWPTADWLEREQYDFYGIVFTGHPDLTRILLPETWAGWPLRKDAPLGYQEVAFTHNTPDRMKPDPDLKKLAPKKVQYRAH
ncbi:MAG: NADH-quinone oxidoreductase subunit C [Candidatus Eisenbacteria bacterium]|uniref:NADH-quinone oxidoreductase subunit C n=1 Tax=Eiseniibacteriota bacterium TaxID=2212470 RepID=A0A538U9K2_UNCEI|nr:MAG: NADH-quinone oxidoreductase subunit C [Candidatus Eisenbacteria bacterium]